MVGWRIYWLVGGEYDVKSVGAVKLTEVECYSPVGEYISCLWLFAHII